MTNRITELVSAEADYDNWHELLPKMFRNHILNAPTFSSLVRATDPDIPRINQANLFAFPSMQTLFADFRDLDWTGAELQRAFLSVCAEISRDIEAFGDRVRADLLVVARAGRLNFVKKNKAVQETSLPPDEKILEGAGFVCRMCEQPIEGYPGILLHACIDMHRDSYDRPIPQVPSFWRRSPGLGRDRPKLWDPALVAYDVQRVSMNRQNIPIAQIRTQSQAAWAVWKALEDYDAELASTCTSFGDVVRHLSDQVLNSS